MQLPTTQNFQPPECFMLLLISGCVMMQVVIVSLETLVTLIFTILYIIRVRRHNKTEAVPDAHMYLQSALYSAPDTNLR